MKALFITAALLGAVPAFAEEPSQNAEAKTTDSVIEGLIVTVRPQVIEPATPEWLKQAPPAYSLSQEYVGVNRVFTIERSIFPADWGIPLVYRRRWSELPTARFGLKENESRARLIVWAW